MPAPLFGARPPVVDGNMRMIRYTKLIKKQIAGIKQITFIRVLNLSSRTINLSIILNFRVSGIYHISYYKIVPAEVRNQCKGQIPGGV
jgi:hypothetical protein